MKDKTVIIGNIVPTPAKGQSVKNDNKCGETSARAGAVRTSEPRA